MNQELTTAPPQQALIVDFKELPQCLIANENLTKKAVAAMTAKLEEVKDINLKELDVQKGDAIEASINDLRSRGTESEKMNRERRMVYTKKMDEIKSTFTSLEKQILEPVAQLATWSNNWNSEKHARAAELQRKNDLKIAHDNAIIDFTNHVAGQIQLRYSLNLATTIQRMSDTFYAKNIADIGQYGADLKAWTVAFSPYTYSVSPNPLLTVEEAAKIQQDTATATFKVLEASWVEKLTIERDRLIELIPSRKMELERNANDAAAAAESAARIAKEAEDRATELAKEEADRTAAAQATADTAKLNNMFESAAVSPAVQLSKGTQVKQKYEPKTHKEVIAVVQWWVANCMNLMTVDELTKKFSVGLKEYRIHFATII